MQYADFRAAAEDAAKELMRLREKHYLTPEQAEAVDLARVRKFFPAAWESACWRRRELQKERRFTARIPASMAGAAMGAGRRLGDPSGAQWTVPLRRMKASIIDFKTDKINTVQSSGERYETQNPAVCLCNGTGDGARVGELFLYSTYLSEGSSRSYHEER